VVVDEEGKNRTNKTTLKSEWRSALKKRLTEPALLEMSGNGVLPSPSSLPVTSRNNSRSEVFIQLLG
jgi:hypothetical protein